VSVTVKVDTSKFDAGLRAYQAYSKKSAPDIVNTKMYFILRQALANTRKADMNKVRRELEVSDVTRVVFTKTGKLSKAKKNKSVVFGGTKYNTQENSRLAKIVNSRRIKEGKTPLHGEELLVEVRRVFAARMRSITFIKSGWLPGLHRFAPLAFSKGGLPPIDKQAKQYGRPKGSGTPAHTGQGDRVKAEAWNNALNAINATKKGGAMRIAAEGLQKGFDAEARSMAGYVAQKRAAAEARFTASQKK